MEALVLGCGSPNLTLNQRVRSSSLLRRTRKTINFRGNFLLWLIRHSDPDRCQQVPSTSLRNRPFLHFQAALVVVLPLTSASISPHQRRAGGSTVRRARLVPPPKIGEQ